MNIFNDYNLALRELFKISSGSLYYTTGSNTLSCSCYESFNTLNTWETTTANYQEKLTDKSILVKSSDVANWNLQPKKSHVVVGNTDYLVGGMINYVANIYQWIHLRTFNQETTASFLKP